MLPGFFPWLVRRWQESWPGFPDSRNATFTPVPIGIIVMCPISPALPFAPSYSHRADNDTTADAHAYRHVQQVGRPLPMPCQYSRRHRHFVVSHGHRACPPVLRQHRPSGTSKPADCSRLDHSLPNLIDRPGNSYFYPSSLDESYPSKSSSMARTIKFDGRIHRRLGHRVAHDAQRFTIQIGQGGNTFAAGKLNADGQPICHLT